MNTPTGKKRISNFILAIIFSLIVAIFAEYISCLSSDEMKRIQKSEAASAELNISQAQANGCSIRDGYLISESDDPMIIFNRVNAYADSVLIEYETPNYSVIPVVIYYTTDEPGQTADTGSSPDVSEDSTSDDPNSYSESRTVSFQIRSDKEKIFVKLGAQVKDLRFDIGCSEGASVKIKRITLNPGLKSYLRAAGADMSLLKMVIRFVILLTICLAVIDFENFKKYLHKYRWAIGGAVIVLGTLCKIHGSSIGRMAELMQGIDTSLLFGQNRAIRTDEYVAFTEMALSQVKSGFGWFSDIWGYSPSDMFLIYGQPVMNPVTILRPFSIGYIILGAERGLAFYWISRIVVGLLVSYEFGRIVTKDDRALSFVYSILVIFAPVVQWWFSTNEFVEMLIAGQCALIIIYHYIRVGKASLQIATEPTIAKTSESSQVIVSHDRTGKSKGSKAHGGVTNRSKTAVIIFKKAALALGLAYCGCVYALSLYPAWMVPLAFVFAAGAAAIIIENRKDIKIKPIDPVIWIIALAAAAGCMAYIFSISGDTIRTIMNTAYPGKRSYDGGPLINFSEIFRGWTSYIWSFTDTKNPCEEVCFISFFPLGIILSIIAVFKKKIKDIWIILLGAVNALLIIYSVIPLPAFIGKITLLGKSHYSRIIVIVGFLNLLIMIRALYVLKGEDLKKYRILFVASCAVSCVISMLNFSEKPTMAVSIIVLFMAGLLGYLVSGINRIGIKAAFVAYCGVLALLGGISVNPISRGLGTVFNEPQIEAIERINSESEGIWMGVGSYMFSNIPTIVGADTASALDTYPDAELWNKIGLAKEEESWNRYAHKVIEVGDRTELICDQDDLVTLYITPQDLDKLGIRYLFSIRDLNDLEGLERIYSYTNFEIYRVSK